MVSTFFLVKKKAQTFIEKTCVFFYRFFFRVGPFVFVLMCLVSFCFFVPFVFVWNVSLRRQGLTLVKHGPVKMEPQLLIEVNCGGCFCWLCCWLFVCLFVCALCFFVVVVLCVCLWLLFCFCVCVGFGC